MILSFEKINYLIENSTNLSYFYRQCQLIQRKEILKNVSGIFGPGLNAILGAYTNGWICLSKYSHDFY